VANRMLRLDEVEALVGFKHSKIYADMEKGEFPKPIRRGTKCVRWFSDEIDLYIETLRAQRDADAA
jgi:prophage regulatory protein